MSINYEIQRSDDDRRDLEGRRELLDRRLIDAEMERNSRGGKGRRKKIDRRNIIERRDD